MQASEHMRQKVKRFMEPALSFLGRLFAPFRFLRSASRRQWLPTWSVASAGVEACV